jgi:hypothetical protein
VAVVGSGPGGGELRRYTAAGEPDAGFGAGGVVALPEMVNVADLRPGADGSEIVAAPATLNPTTAWAVRLARVAADGTVTTDATVRLPFGGGVATRRTVHRAPVVTPLAQTGFRAGHVVLRPDGSLLVPGAVGVIQYTAEGEGFEVDEAAVAAIAPSLTALDPAFGGAAMPARVRIGVPAQRATSAASPRLLRIAITATTSGPGLARLTVRWRGVVVARSTAPVYATGGQRLAAYLTLAGRRALRSAHHVRITVTATFRDLAGEQARSTTRATLR